MKFQKQHGIIFAVVLLAVLIFFLTIQDKNNRTAESFLPINNLEPLVLSEKIILKDELSPDVLEQGLVELAQGFYDFNGFREVSIDINKFSNVDKAKEYFQKRINFWKNKDADFKEISLEFLEFKKGTAFKAVISDEEGILPFYELQSGIFVVNLRGGAEEEDYGIILFRGIMEDLK